MMRRSSVVFVLIAVPAVLVLAGCSDKNKRFTVQGSVSYQGKPLSAGLVRLYMAEDRKASAKIQSDGSFTVTDVLPGEAKVTVEPEDPAEKMRRMMSPEGGPQGAAPKPAPPPTVSLPAKYQDVTTTDLIFTLEPGIPLKIELR